MRRTWAMLVLVVVTVAGCTQSAAPATGRQQTEASPTPQGRTLLAALKAEPASIAARPLQEASGIGLYFTERMFNASIGLLDDQAVPMPYLVESLPQLDTDDWQLFPDGTMRTTYHLKPNVVWHDGAPLSSDDFVFAWQLYSRPDLGSVRRLPMDVIDSVEAPDPATFVINWKRPYPDASSLTNLNAELPPLPRHILQAAVDGGSADTVVNHPYWNREFVGLGPFRLDRWEPGSFIEASAFDQHVLGKAKIARIKISFIGDSQTVVANLLTGDVQLAALDAVRLDQAQTLRRQWQATGGGDFAGHPNQWRAVFFQYRPDLVNPRALLNPNVRKALASAVDKQSIDDAVYGGALEMADSMIPAKSRWGEAASQTTVRYPYDPRRAEELMAAAGYTRVGDAYTSPTDGQFTAELKTNGASDNVQEMQILASGWRDRGFNVLDAVLPIAQAQDNEVRATFSAMYSNNGPLGETALMNEASSRIPSADNRWNGNNRGGWVNPEYDRLLNQLNTTLASPARAQLAAQMVNLFTDDLGGISLFFRVQPWVHSSALKGLEKTAAPEAMQAWNITDWELQ